MFVRFYRGTITIKSLAHLVTYRSGFQVQCPIISICLLIAIHCKVWRMVGQLLLTYISTLSRFHRCYSPPDRKSFQSPLARLPVNRHDLEGNNDSSWALDLSSVIHTVRYNCGCWTLVASRYRF